MNVVFLDFCETKLTEKAKLLKVKRQLTLVLSFATVFQLKCLIKVTRVIINIELSSSASCKCYYGYVNYL